MQYSTQNQNIRIPLIFVRVLPLFAIQLVLSMVHGTMKTLSNNTVDFFLFYFIINFYQMASIAQLPSWRLSHQQRQPPTAPTSVWFSTHLSFFFYRCSDITIIKCFNMHENRVCIRNTWCCSGWECGLRLLWEQWYDKIETNKIGWLMRRVA